MLRFNKEVLVTAYQGVLVQALLVKIPCYRINKECPCWDFNKDSLLSLTRSSLLNFQQGHPLLSLTESLRRSSSYRLSLTRGYGLKCFGRRSEGGGRGGGVFLCLLLSLSLSLSVSLVLSLSLFVSLSPSFYFCFFLSLSISLYVYDRLQKPPSNTK